MKFLLPLLFLLILLQSCDAFTEKRAVSAKEFYELKDNVTITKVTEGQILEKITPIAQHIYLKIATKKEEVIQFLEKNPNQKEVYQFLNLDSTELAITEKIAYYKNTSEIEYDAEKQIFEAYQTIEDTLLYQQNLQILHGKNKVLYNYPNFNSKENIEFSLFSLRLLKIIYKLLT